MLISKGLPCPQEVAFTEFECSGQGLVGLGVVVICLFCCFVVLVFVCFVVCYL